MKRLNARRVKINRSYTIGEVARLFAVHKNTVREWLKRGLQTADDRRPTLILGRHLVTFLHARRLQRRKRCQSGELYCFRCRAPRPAAGKQAQYVPYTEASGNLQAQCRDCGTRMFRRVSRLKLVEVAGEIQVQVLQALERLRGRSSPSVNCDLEKETNRAVAQSRK